MLYWNFIIDNPIYNIIYFIILIKTNSIFNIIFLEIIRPPSLPYFESIFEEILLKYIFKIEN